MFSFLQEIRSVNVSDNLVIKPDGLAEDVFLCLWARRKTRCRSESKTTPTAYTLRPFSPTPTHPSMQTTLRNSPLPPIPPPPAPVLMSEMLCVFAGVWKRWMVVVPLRRRSRIWSPVSDVMEFLISCTRVSHPPFIKLPRELRETRPRRSRTHPKCPRLIPLKSANIE